MAAGWRRLATLTAGTVAALAAAPARSGPLLLAATSVGVYRSAEAGRSWALAGGAGVPFPEVLTASPRFAQDQTIFAGSRAGLYRSPDGGETWHRALEGASIIAMALAEAAEGKTVIVAGTEADGILRSEDAGRNWARANPGLLDLTVLALALSPRFQQDRTGFAGTASGLYRTRSGGAAWRLLNLPVEEPVVQCLAVSPDFAEDGLVLAGTETDGLLRSDNAGSSFELVPDLAERGISALAFSSRPAPRRTVAAATDQGIALSHDGGTTWRSVGGQLGPVLSLAYVPTADGEALLAGLPVLGVARSDDGGATWALSNDGLSARLLAGLTLSPDFARDQTLFVADLERGVVVSTDGGRTWAERQAGLEVPAVLGLAVSPDFSRDRTLFAATPAGIHHSSDGGTTWRLLAANLPAPPKSLAIGPSPGPAPAVLLAALQDGHLVVSDDQGETWRSLGQPFDGAEVLSLACSPDYAHDRTLFAATSRPTQDGTGELVLWRSVDGGRRWERWLVEAASDLLPLAVPRADQPFVGVGQRVLRPLRQAQEIRSGQRRPIWRGADLGAEASRVTALAVSPVFEQDRTVFAATTGGAFVSRDGGETFTPWSEDLTPASLVSLALSPGYAHDRQVYALGLGGTVWRRDDQPA